MPGGIKSDEDFWELLSNRKVVRVPVKDRFGQGYEPIAGQSGPSRFASPYEGLMINEEELLFDSKLFGLSPYEAKFMDPQIKLLLSSTWEAFEKAGWDLNKLRNSSTGVFIGTQISASGNWRPPEGVNEFTIPGSSLSMFANRISYHFNLMGPSTTTLTACSSGISAMHTAINALQCGDCEQAVVGSSNYLGSTLASAGFNALGVISPDGRCYSFDASANGYMRSEGVFIYILKSLEAAERDGDVVHAVIKGSFLNTAGAIEGSQDFTQGRYITAPTAHAQIDLMRTVCERVGMKPEEFDYIEAHATGTKLGDRIEGNAVGEVFGGANRKQALRVASVKSNLGHMEAAAFHCALLKIILMLKHRHFAPISENYKVPNPEIDFIGNNMRVQTTCEPFPDHPVTVGINSFGFGGANGMCVVEEYRPQHLLPNSIPLTKNRDYLFPLSARSADALSQYIHELKETVNSTQPDLYTLAGNLSRRHTHFNVRSSVVARSLESLQQALEAVVEEPDAFVNSTKDHRILMVFAGQGTQWAGAARELYDTQPVFRRTIDAIDDYWKNFSDVSLKWACFEAEQEALDECELAQPVIFTIQCALVELYKTWGIYPEGVVGHSAGEVAAAYACGALTLEEATRLVHHRATLQQKTSGSGRMLAIALDEASVRGILDELQVNYKEEAGNIPDVEIACLNAPASVVACGKEVKLQPIIDELTRRNIPKKLLRGRIAFHSHAMEPIKAEVYDQLGFLDDIDFDPEVPFISTVTGQNTQRLDCDYWWSNIRRTVRFMDALREAHRICKPTVFLEIAPHSALTAVTQQCFEQEGSSLHFLTSLKRGEDAGSNFHESLGALFQIGVDLDFAQQFPRPKTISHLLPGHPKDEQVTIDRLIDDRTFVRQGDYSWGPLDGRKIAYSEPSFEVRMSARDFPYLVDHRVQQKSIVPAAAYIEMVLQAMGEGPVHFDALEFLKPCEVGDTAVRLQTKLEAVNGTKDSYTFSIQSSPYEPGSKSTLHCKGKVRKAEPEQLEMIERKLSPMKKTNFQATRFQDAGAYYEHMQAVIGEFFQYGPYFQAIQNIAIDVNTKELLLDLKMDATLFEEGREAGYILPPSLMDGALQSFIYFLMQATDFSGIPMRAEQFTLFSRPTSASLICHYRPPAYWSGMHEKGQLVLALGEESCGSITLYDGETNELVAHLGQYYSFHANSKRGDLVNNKKVINWQPKFIDDPTFVLNHLSSGPIAPASLIRALEARGGGENPYACRIIELVNHDDPKDCLVNECLDYLNSDASSTEYWLLCSTEESTLQHYELLNYHNATLRFDHFELAQQDGAFKPEGLARLAAAEAVVMQYQEFELNDNTWQTVRQLLVPGGIVWLKHPDGILIDAPKGWNVLRSEGKDTLLQAPVSLDDIVPVGEPVEEIHWVLGEPDSYADEWVQQLRAKGIPYSVIPWDAVTNEKLVPLDQWPNAENVTHVEFFCGLDDQDPTGEQLAINFVNFAKVFVGFKEFHTTAPSRLTLVTQNASYLIQNPRGAAIWGAVRSLTLEIASQLELDIQLVDLGSNTDLPTLGLLNGLRLREREMAVRANQIWVPRVLNIREEFPQITASNDKAYRLFVDHPGQITGLRFKTYSLPELGPEDVEIDVDAAAINFRDIMVALGRLPLLSYERSALGHEVGMEASGKIRSVGSNVEDFKPGDEVVFMKGGCIGNRVITPAKSAFHKPDSLSMAEAAGVMSVYVTSYYSLIYLARLKKGQRVLIHSAMGGVGQSAIALAKLIGAEIYTTAGTPEKRAKLMELGAKGAFDSHSFSWYDDLMDATDGEGVDVVLNSLAGHHIALCLEALRPGGYHCEIGKVDIYADNPLNLCVFRKNIRFLAIDIDRLIKDDPELIRELSEKCVELFDQELVPALPITVYNLSGYLNALRSMMNGEHQGKLILRIPQEAQDPNLQVIDTQPFLDKGATYLISGGFGGLGLRLLTFLADAGAKHLTLMDRDPEGKRTVEWIRRKSSIHEFFPDVEIRILQGDVSRREDVDRCVQQLDRPLKGVFHLAGVLDDKRYVDLDAGSFQRVFAAKAYGAYYLHEATKGLELDHFVVLSSVASAFGSPTQVNYSAANAFLDGLTSYRRHMGLPGLAFNMGAVAEVGMAARDAHVLRMVKAGGMPPISALFAINGLDYAMRHTEQYDHLITALFKNIPWTVDHPDYMRFGSLLANQEAFSMKSGGQMTPESITAQIVHKVSELCGFDEIDVHEPLASFGLNSISVTELAAYVNSQFNYQVSVIDLMTNATTASMVNAIIEKNSGKQADTNVSEEKQEEEVAEADITTQKTQQRKPSRFAIPYEEHFPDSSARLVKSLLHQNGHSNPVKESKNGTIHHQFDKLQEPDSVNGKFPPDCQTDIDSLKTAIIDTLRRETPADAVSPTEFKNVFLTGVTGFIGRFILRDLLAQHEQLLVYCLVRAESPEKGMDRIREAMEFAEIWQDEYAERIIPLAGDMQLPQFGLTHDTFAALSEQVDAVYHFAAHLSLASPYKDIRKVNTLSMQNVLELSLTYRKKHIFFASTMGVFPSYFCDFAQEFKDASIGHQVQPDLSEMKRVFPIGFVGYPWSKVVVEQSLLFAHDLGVPVALFRIPSTGLTAETGYTQSNDIKYRIASAALDLKMKAGNLVMQWTEPADVVSRICTAISLNPERRNLIYHCCNPGQANPGIGFAEFGFDLEPVSYTEFKEACLARGESSPLHKHWSLLDFFGPYWFSEDKRIGSVPVSDRAIREDCTFDIEWPGLIEMTANSTKWVERHREDWPYVTPEGEIGMDLLLKLAEQYARSMDVDFGKTYPEPVLEALDHLVEALNEPEAQLLPERKSISSLMLSRRLYNLATLSQAESAHPEIREQQFNRPVFIIGINRTGTTFLHNLLAADRKFWTLKMYEMWQPAAPEGNFQNGNAHKDPRLKFMKDLVAGLEAEEVLQGIHRVDLQAPEEDFPLLEQSFLSWTYTTQYYVPKYYDWLKAKGLDDAYELHHRMMQHFTWQRRQAQSLQQGTWLFKMPFHLMSLDSLLKTYPDALFIQTHRHPNEFLSSWNHLVDQSRAAVAQSRSKSELGLEQLDFMNSMLGKVVQFREDHPELEDRWFDISYYDLIKDPFAIIDSLYQKWDLPLDETTRGSMKDWMERQAARRAGELRHEHHLEDFDLQPETVSEAFSDYLEFMERKGFSLKQGSLTLG